jgi:exopolysaccharide biosynthesis protein
MIKLKRFFKKNWILFLFFVLTFFVILLGLIPKRNKKGSIAEIAFKNKAAKELIEIKIGEVEEEINKIEGVKEEEEIRREERKLQIAKLEEKKDEISTMDAESLDAFFINYIRNR